MPPQMHTHTWLEPTYFLYARPSSVYAQLSIINNVLFFVLCIIMNIQCTCVAFLSYCCHHNHYFIVYIGQWCDEADNTGKDMIITIIDLSLPSFSMLCERNWRAWEIKAYYYDIKVWVGEWFEEWDLNITFENDRVLFPIASLSLHSEVCYKERVLFT